MKYTDGGIPVCKYCGFADTQAVPRQCCSAGEDYDALAAEVAAWKRNAREACEESERLAARLAEAEALLRAWRDWFDEEGAHCRVGPGKHTYYATDAFLTADSAGAVK